MAQETSRNIPTINEELDLKLLQHVAKRNIYFLIIFVVLAILGSFLYLRYTPPVYRANAIIQIEEESAIANQFSPFQFWDDDLARKVELMRSTMYLNRTLAQLPLEISYFNRGRFLNHELYRSAPFRVEVNIKNGAIYGVPIHLDFQDNALVRISYTLNSDISRTIEAGINQTVAFPEVDVTVILNSPESNPSLADELTRNPFFFVINNPNYFARQYGRNLDINILNASARTINISKSGRNPRKTTEIVNAIAEEFNEIDIEMKAESADQILEYINRQLETVFTQLVASELELDQFKREHDLDETIITPLTEIHERISHFENQIVALRMEEMIFAEIENILNSKEQVDIFKLVAILSGSEFTGMVSAHLQSLQQLLMNRERLLYEVTPDSRQIAGLDFQISIQKRVLIESINALQNNLKTNIANLEAEVSKYEETLQNRATRFNMSELSRLQRIFAVNESFYNKLVEEMARHSIARAGLVSQSIVLEHGTIPAHPVSPIAQNIYLGGLAFAFFLGIGIILLKYLFYDKITSLRDVLRYSQTSVLGIVPKYHGEIPKNQLLVTSRPKSIIAESLRSIRTNLQFINNAEGSKLITVTSTVSGEGKTFFSVNLSGILAFSNKKVVVIDFDMRRPNIHKAFNVQNLKGISTILSGLDAVDDCIINSETPNLDLITAGPIPPNPSELILSPRMEQLIANLRERYDYIIIDTPPVGVVTDGMKSLLMSDYPIYLLMAGFSKRQFFESINRLAVDGQASKLAVVLNRVDPEFTRYGFGHGYSYDYLEYGKEYFDEPELKNKSKFSSKNFFMKIWNKFLG